MDPISLINREDCSICGSCDMRGEPTNDPNAMSAKSAPVMCLKRDRLAVWKGAQNGIYPRIKGHENIADIAYGRMRQLYGDPSAVPTYIWESLNLKQKDIPAIAIMRK